MPIIKPKLIRVTTMGISLNKLIPGQLKFLNNFYEVTAISSKGIDLDIVKEREKVKVFPLRMKRNINLFMDIISLLKFCFYFFKEKPIIVHSNTPKASLLSMIAAYLTRVPVRIYTVTGLRFEGYKGIKMKFYILMEKITCFFANHIIPEGEGVKRKMIVHKITNKPMEIIHYGNINGVDLNYFSKAHYKETNRKELKNQLLIPINDIVFIFVGRLVKDKGIVDLVSAFKNLSKSYQNCSLLLVGGFEHDLDPLPEDIIKEINIHNKIFAVGYKDDVRPFLDISDVLTFPSYREGFPNAVIQACAMELAVIISDVNGANEIITPNVNGIIIPRKDENMLFSTMKRFLDEKELKKCLTSKSREIVMHKFNSIDIWLATKERYDLLLNTF